MSYKPLLAGVGLLVAVVATASPAFADLAAARGAITDSSGRPLAGVDVELRTAGGALVAHTVTDARGEFSIGAVAAGAYELTAFRSGFRPAVQDLVLPPASDRPLAIALPPGFAETVVVQAPPLNGPGVSPSGANDFTMGAPEIGSLPAGAATPLADVLARMPGVAIDQNQQIHIRNTEGPQLQYQINGVMVPRDRLSASLPTS
jgi:Carboxypeptidase regulatory-like domain